MPPKRQSYSQAELAQLIAQEVANAMATYQTGRDRDTQPTPVVTTKPCTYKDFMNCKPLNFSGTEGAIGLIRWIEKMESVFRLCNCTEECKVKFSTCTLSDSALTWWNTYAQTVGIEVAYQLPWEDLKKMMRDEYCPREELQQLEVEFWNLTVKGNDITSYTTRFHQLALLCPSMVDPEFKRIDRYIWGLPAQIQGMVTASKPGTIQSAVRMAHSLMAQVVRRETPTTGTNKRGRDEDPGDDNQYRQPVKRPETTKVYVSRSEERSCYGGNFPYCSSCNHHHAGPCSAPCGKCKIRGHQTRDCKFFPTTATSNSPKACFECGDTGHFMRDCPKRGNRNDNRNNHAR